MSELRQGNIASRIMNMMSGKGCLEERKICRLCKKIAGDESRRMKDVYGEKLE